jgi:raffinose/stachyose/melibiose transport system permease protein
MFRYTKWTLLREVLVWIFALFMLLPLYLLINNSLKDSLNSITYPLGLVVNPDFGNFVTVLESTYAGSLPLGMLNSFIITAVGVSILVFFGSMTAYVLARRTSKVSKVTFYLILVGIIVPAQLGIVPIYVFARSIGLLGSVWGLGIIYGMMLMPLSVFLYAGFVRSLPTDYEEAAFIDGSSRFNTFRKIVFPLLSPATGTVAILGGIIMWNDFFTPLIFLNNSVSPTIALVVYAYAGNPVLVEWNLVFALLILAMIPITILYLIFQKRFIQGFSGGIKS